MILPGIRHGRSTSPRWAWRCFTAVASACSLPRVPWAHALGLGLAIASTRAVVHGQASELFVTKYQDTITYVIRNVNVVRQFHRASLDEPALVVHATIKALGHLAGMTGHQYDVNGTHLAGQYTNTGQPNCNDGATVGTRNWTI